MEQRLKAGHFADAESLLGSLEWAIEQLLRELSQLTASSAPPLAAPAAVPGALTTPYFSPSPSA